MVAVAGSGLRPAPWIIGRRFYRVVQDYGADPTGAANSTGPINAAIAACGAAGGGTVFFDAGTYKCNIAWDGLSYINLLGFGVVLTPNNAALPTVSIKGTSSPANDCSIQGQWWILGGATFGSNAPCLLVNIQTNSAASFFENIQFNGGSNGVWVQGTGVQGAAFYGRNLQMFGSTGPNASLYITGSTANSGNVQIDHAQITNAGAAPGITVTGGLGHSFYNVDCEDTGDGVQLLPAANPAIQDIFFTNCTIAAGGHTPAGSFGYKIGASGGGVENCRITGGEASGYSGQSGIVVNDSGATGRVRGLVVDGVYAGGNVDGVLINSASGNCIDWRVMNCTMIGNATAGIQIAQPTIDFWVLNNYIAGADGGAATPFGVVSGTAGANYGRVKDNSVRQNVTTGIAGSWGANVDFGGFNGTPPGTNY